MDTESSSSDDTDRGEDGQKRGKRVRNVALQNISWSTAAPHMEAMTQEGVAFLESGNAVMATPQRFESPGASPPRPLPSAVPLSRPEIPLLALEWATQPNAAWRKAHKGPLQNGDLLVLMPGTGAASGTPALGDAGAVSGRLADAGAIAAAESQSHGTSPVFFVHAIT